MTNYADTVTKHAVWSTAEQVKSELGEEYPDSAAARDAVARARFLLSTLEERRGGEPFHYTAGSLDKVNTHLSSLVQALTQLRGNDGHAPQVHQEINGALAAMASWPAAKSPRLTQPVRDAADEHISQLEGQAARAAEAITANEAATQAKLEELTVKYDELAKEHQELLAQIRATDDSATTAIDALSAKFDAAKTAWDETAERQRDALTRENTEHREKWNAAATTELEGIKGIAHEAGVVAGAVAEKQIADHYKDYADEQRLAANRWNIVTVVVLVALTGGIAWALHGLSAVTWQASALRFGVTLTVLAVAGYCGAQVAGHRREERKARRIQHGLSSIGAFMATVDDDRRNAVRSVIATQLFEDDMPKDAPGEAGLASQASHLLASARNRAPDGKSAGVADPTTPADA